MRCSQCGQLLPDSSRFCNACGAEMVAALPVDQRVTVGNQAVLADEHEVFTVRPTMIFVVIRSRQRVASASSACSRAPFARYHVHLGGGTGVSNRCQCGL